MTHTRVFLPLCGLVLDAGQLAALRGQSLYFDPNGHELAGNGIEAGEVYDWSTDSAHWSVSDSGTAFQANTGWQSGAYAYFSADRYTSAPALSVRVGAGGVIAGGITVNNGDVTIAAGGGAISTNASSFGVSVDSGRTLTWADGLASAPANFTFGKTGQGTLVLGALAPTTTRLALAGGTLRLSADDALATSAPLRIEGSYRLELAGTTQSIGILAITGSGGANLVDLGGGSLTVREWASGIVNLGTGGTFTVSDPTATPGTQRTLGSGRTEGSGTFVKDDAGTLVLGPSAILAHSGDVEVRGGTLAISTSGNAIAHDYAISSGATLSLRSQLTGTGGGTGHALVKAITGAGTLELNGSSGYGSASLRLADGGSLDPDLNLRIGANDFLNLDGRSATVASIGHVSAGNYATVRLPAASALTLGDGASSIAAVGTGSVTKDGAGIAAVRWTNSESSTANNFSGSLHATTGTLRLNETAPGSYSHYVNAVALARPSVTVAAGATLESQGAWITRLTGAGNTTLSTGTLTVGSGSLSTSGTTSAPSVEAFTYDGVISGSGNLTKTGSSDWTLTADHTFSGTTRIDHGRLILGDGGATGSLAGSIQLGGTNNAYYTASVMYPSDTPTLVLNRSGTYTFGNAVYDNSGGYGAIVNQTGDVTLTGVKQAAINVAGGRVTFGSGLGSQSVLGYVASGATADIAGYTVQSYRFTNQGTIRTGTGSALQIYSGADLSTPSTGAITGDGSLVKKDRGYAELTTNPLGILRNTLELGGASTYSGGTTLEGGTLRALSATAFGTGPILVTRVDPAGPGTSWQTSTLDLNGQAVANTIDYRAGAIRNMASFQGLLSIRTTADITGQIGGTVRMGQGGSLDLAGRTIRASFVNEGSGNGSIALGGGRVEVGTSSRQFQYNGNLTGSGTLVKTDTGLAESPTPGASWNNTLDLAGSRSYTGTTRVEGGTLILRNRDAAGTSNIVMVQAAPSGGFAEGGSAQTTTVDLSNTTASNSIDYQAGVLRGMENYGGQLTVRTAAVFENSARISGNIVVANGGTLPGHTYSGFVRLQSGGGLLGGGTFNTLLIVDAGGYINLADGAASTLTVRSSLFLGTGRSLTLELGSLFHDSIAVQGLFTAGGLLEVEFAPDSTFVGGEEFHLITAQSYAGEFDEVRLPTLNAGLSWDTSRLASAGVLSVSSIPEPATAAALLGLASLGLAASRRRTRR